MAIYSSQDYLATKEEADALKEKLNRLKTEKKNALNSLTPEQKDEIKKNEDKKAALKAEKERLDERQAEIVKISSHVPALPWWVVIGVTFISFVVSSFLLDRNYANVEQKDEVSPIYFAVCTAIFVILFAIRMVGVIKFKKVKKELDAEKAKIYARLSEVDREIKEIPDEKELEKSFCNKDYDGEIKALKDQIDALEKDMSDYHTTKKLANHIFVYIGTYSAKPNESYYGRYGSISQARVTIDGEDRGSTRTLRGFAVTPGRHTISVEVYEESNEIYGNSTPETFFVSGDYQVYFYRLNTYNHNLSLRTYDNINDFRRESMLAFDVSKLV